MLKKYKKIFISLGVLLGVILIVYWFFAKTVRGNSWALYLAGGWHAPFAVKWDCAKETDKNVEQKFNRPLKFDEASKNLLKNFWYYSYFRSCLYKHGYDFSGYPIPKSLLSVNVYENQYAGISFNIPEESIIIADNILDVDTDDRLFISQFKTPSGILNLHYYSKHDIFTSADEINAKMQSIPLTQGIITAKKLVELPLGKNAFEISQNDGSIGLVFITDEGKVFIIFGNENIRPLLEGIKKSLSFS